VTISSGEVLDTTIERARVAIWADADESVTRAVKLKVPAADTGPLMWPVASRARPVGSEPEASDQE
jgi:hypothetical protein